MKGEKDEENEKKDGKTVASWCGKNKGRKHI